MRYILSKLKTSQSNNFIVSMLLVNLGNYVFNVALGRLLGPELFSEIAFLVTLLLVLSFLAMTIQLVSTKYSIELPDKNIVAFKGILLKSVFILGIIIASLFIYFSNTIAAFFQIKSVIALYIFGISIPLYFIMSVMRGIHQGKQQFNKLSLSYILEMITRLSISLLLILYSNIHPTIAVSFSILLSFIIGLFPGNFSLDILFKKGKIPYTYLKEIYLFILFTTSYECSLIIINNSDILLVKHYFNAKDAGIYASLALIGRVVYYMIWMLIMLFIPKIIDAKKNNKNPKDILLKYCKGTFVLVVTIILFCFLFPNTIISLLFGNEYISISPLLYKYAIATSLFALANLFTYYFLSLSKFIPVLITLLFGFLQLFLLTIFHNTLEQVIMIQVYLMFLLLLSLITFYFKNS